MHVRDHRDVLQEVQAGSRGAAEPVLLVPDPPEGRELLDDLDEVHALQRAERVRSLRDLVPLVDGDGGAGHRHRDDLVREDREVVRSHDHGFELFGEGPPRDHGGLREVVLVGRDDEPVGDLPDAVAGAADPLDEAGHLPRGVVLEDEVRGPHVDPELEGGRADQPLQDPRLEVVLHLDPDVLRQGAVVDAEGRVREPRVRAGREELRGVPRVHEEERRAVGVDQLVALPDRRGLDVLQVELLRDVLVLLGGDRDLHVDPDPLRDRDLDHLDLAADAAEEPRDLLRTTDGRGEADPLHVSSDELDEPLQTHGELRAPVVPRELVDLVHDDPLQGPELVTDVAPREQDLERLRGRDQDVRGMAGDLRPLLRRGVPVADRDLEPELLAEERHPTEHVPVQRPERGDVQAAHGLGLLREDPVEDREDRGFRLPNPRGRDHQDALPRQDAGDRSALGLRELVEPELRERVDDPRIKT